MYGLGTLNIFLLYLVAEPFFIPVVASSVSMLTCNHLDVHRPFPHLARDDTLRCNGPDHLPLMAMGAAVALAAPLVAAWWGSVGLSSFVHLVHWSIHWSLHWSIHPFIGPYIGTLFILLFGEYVFAARLF